MLYILDNKGVCPMDILHIFLINLVYFLNSYMLYTIVIKKHAVSPIK